MVGNGRLSTTLGLLVHAPDGKNYVREPGPGVEKSCHLLLHFDDGTLSVCQAMCSREKEGNESVTVGVRHHFGSSGHSGGFLRCCLALASDIAHAPSSEAALTQGHLGSNWLPLSVPLPPWNSCHECLISTLICNQTLAFRLGHWGRILYHRLEWE